MSIETLALAPIIIGVPAIIISVTIISSLIIFLWID